MNLERRRPWRFSFDQATRAALPTNRFLKLKAFLVFTATTSRH